MNGKTVCQAHGGAKYKPGDIVAKALDGVQKPRCNYHKRNGEQCKNPPVKGTTVCRKHGGAAAHIQRKARERLNEMVLPAITQLNKILLAPGTSDSDKVRVALAVLDRTGFGKESNVNVEVEVKPWEKTMESILTAIPEGSTYGYDNEDIEDAEVIEESTGPVEDYSPRERFGGPVIGPEGLVRTGPRIGSADPPRGGR